MSDGKPAPHAPQRASSEVVRAVLLIVLACLLPCPSCALFYWLMEAWHSPMITALLLPAGPVLLGGWVFFTARRADVRYAAAVPFILGAVGYVLVIAAALMR